ncbi:hypothetical protein PCASD_14859 [Puccinia coronata f. sp. avenae]|uniref:Uncharacterized protein n=1 Tax=Puccinia coronata f. sp. avenae TaxID=200324 RepID=A0A2N5TZR0_9BASI|nr:hypothetical protein PCASD_14859 [Puccinia coronata f. sp. avenae]
MSIRGYKHEEACTKTYRIGIVDVLLERDLGLRLVLTTRWTATRSCRPANATTHRNTSAGWYRHRSTDSGSGRRTGRSSTSHGASAVAEKVQRDQTAHVATTHLTGVKSVSTMVEHRV